MLATLDIRRFALPVLTELSVSTGETAALTVWSAAEAVVVEQVASTQIIKHTVPLGTRYTNLDSASVQVFAAEAEVTGQHPEPGLTARLEEVRMRGYAVNHAATSPDVVGIAAGVRDHRGELVAAIIVAAPCTGCPMTGSASSGMPARLRQRTCRCAWATAADHLRDLPHVS